MSRQACGDTYGVGGDDFHTICENVSHNQEQSFSELQQPGRSTNDKHELICVQTFHCFKTSSVKWMKCVEHQ